MKTNKAPDIEVLLAGLRERLASVKLEIPEIERLEAGLDAVPVQTLEQPAPPEAASEAPVRPAPQTLVHTVSARKRPGRVLLAAGTLLALFLWHLSGLWPWVVHRSVDLPFAQATGLASKGNAVLIADKKRQLLFTFDAGRMQVQSVKRFPNPSVSGLAWGDACLWSTEAEAGRIYQHGLDQEHKILHNFENRERSPGAVFWDGMSLWISDAQTEMIYQFAPGSFQKVTRQYYLPGIAAGGMQVRDGRLWVLDSITQTVYRYKLDSGTTLSAEESIHLGRWLPPYCLLTGFAMDSGSIWVVSDNPSQLHRFDLRRIRP